MTELALYEAAYSALQAAVNAREVLRVRVTAEGLRAVGRAAGNLDFEIKAMRLRTEAEARLGEMMEVGERDGVISSHGGKRRQDSESESCPATLKELGIAPKVSAQSRKLHGIGARAVNVMLDRMERESRKTGKLQVNVIADELGKRNTTTRRQLAQELSDATALSPTGRKFPVLYADPAWRRKAGIGNRAYENTYVTDTWAEICAMPVKERLLPDAWGFIWITRAHLLALHPIEVETSLGLATVKMPLIWAVAHSWGFDSYSTCAIWTKTDEECPDDHGLGLIFWDQDEILCVFKRGRGLPKPDSDIKFGSNHRERAGEHSAKPTYYRDMINAMTGGVPVLELFAREDDDQVLPPNFYTWGNQSKGTADAPTDSSGNTIPHDESGEVVEPVSEAAE